MPSLPTADPYLPGHGDPSWSATHYALDLDYDLVGNRLAGTAVIEAVADQDITRVVLDLAYLQVQKVTVDGSVTEPGVYAIQGRTTLLDALAMAKGTTRVAALDQVLIFREENGENMVARFNVQAIRHGEAPNPEIQGNDIIVVGFSNLKGFYRDVLTMAPLLAAFGNFTRYR